MHRQAVAFPINDLRATGAAEKLERGHSLAALGRKETVARAEESALFVKGENVEHSLVRVFGRERSR